jgi:hypothetical protein
MSALNVQSDWDNRHFIANIQYNIMKVVAFLNDFGTSPGTHMHAHTHAHWHDDTSPSRASPFPPSPPLMSRAAVCCAALSDSTTRLRLARLNEKLSRLERQMDYLEASVQNVAEANAEAQRQQSQR